MAHFLDRIAPPNVRSFLRQLAQREWLEITPNSNRGISLAQKSTGDPAFDTEVNLMCRRLSSDNGMNVLENWVMGKFLKDGPKVVSPSAEQCEMLRLVDANLTLSDFMPPFETVAIFWPDELMRSLSKEHGKPCSQLTVMHYDRAIPYLVSLSGGGFCDTNEHLLIIGDTNLIEQNLKDWESRNEMQASQTMVLNRIAINLCLLLTRYGYTEEPECDERRKHREPRKLANTKIRRKRQQHRQQLQESATKLVLSQEVTFSRHIPNVGMRNGVGGEKSPHWRRGHFRRQRVGCGRTETKLVFIPPMLIRADRFSGDRADIEYRIKV